jgi:hypothetical protein
VASYKQPRRYGADEVLLYGGFCRCAHCGKALSPKQHTHLRRFSTFAQAGIHSTA